MWKFGCPYTSLSGRACANWMRVDGIGILAEVEIYYVSRHLDRTAGWFRDLSTVSDISDAVV
jgi:hypothetical protein